MELWSLSHINVSISQVNQVLLSLQQLIMILDCRKQQVAQFAGPSADLQYPCVMRHAYTLRQTLWL